VINARKIELIIGLGEFVIGKCESGIAFDRLGQQANSLEEALS
jgi:hypothetical protein